MSRCHSRGLSLFEFSVALIVVSVSALYAAPMYYKIINNYHATQYTNELVLALNYARLQAATRVQSVSVCSSDDGRHCSDTPWTLGYIVFVDAGVPGVVDPGDRVLRQRLIHRAKATITLRGNRYIRFNSMGGLLARNAGEADLIASENLFVKWFDRLSPVSAAHAEPARFSVQERSNEEVELGAHVGVFTICARRTGRTVRLSAQGRITTHDTRCS